MVRIRLRRIGAKKKPAYRIVVADKRSPRDGRFIETVGFYNPCTEPETVDIQSDRIVHWLGQGAQPSDSVARILRRNGVIDEQGKATAANGTEAADGGETESEESVAEDSGAGAESEETEAAVA